MVVDDHDVRRQGLAPRQMHVAFAKAGALRTQAVLTGGSDQRYHRRAFVQPRQLRQVARARAMRPTLDLGQNPCHARLTGRHILARQFHAVQAQIARPALQKRHAHRQAQGLRQPREIARKQLVLQGLGGGGQQHPLAAQKCRDQIGKSLAHPRACLHDQRPARFDGVRHGHGHLRLAFARLEMRFGPRQHAAGGKHLLHHLHQRHQAGSWG